MKLFGTIDPKATEVAKIKKLRMAKNVIGREVDQLNVSFSENKKKIEMEAEKQREEIRNEINELLDRKRVVENEILILEKEQETKIASMAKLVADQKKTTQKVRKLEKQLTTDLAEIERVMGEANEVLKTAAVIREEASIKLEKARNEAKCIEDMKNLANSHIARLDASLRELIAVNTSSQEISDYLSSIVKRKESDILAGTIAIRKQQEEIEKKNRDILAEKRKLKAVFEIMQQYGKK